MSVGDRGFRSRLGLNFTHNRTYCLQYTIIVANFHVNTLYIYIDKLFWNKLWNFRCLRLKAAAWIFACDIRYLNDTVRWNASSSAVHDSVPHLLWDLTPFRRGERMEVNERRTVVGGWLATVCPSNRGERSTRMHFPPISLSFPSPFLSYFAIIPLTSFHSLPLIQLGNQGGCL